MVILPPHLLAASSCRMCSSPTPALASASAWRKTWKSSPICRHLIIQRLKQCLPCVWVGLFLLLQCLSPSSATGVCWPIALLLRLWSPHWLRFRLWLEKAKEPSVDTISVLRCWWWWWQARRTFCRRAWWRGRRISKLNLWIRSSNKESGEYQEEFHVGSGWGGLLLGSQAPTHWGAEPGCEPTRLARKAKPKHPFLCDP